MQKEDYDLKIKKNLLAWGGLKEDGELTPSKFGEQGHIEIFLSPKLVLLIFCNWISPFQLI
jgi:hypothetical protein